MVYKTLILEDNEIDASLMEQYLNRSDYDFDVRWIDSGDSYEEAIGAFEPDVIISDYRLKQYSGLDALYYRNMHCEDTPFLVVSGTIGEERAVELVKEGATDFLIKNNAEKRLDQAVIRAIKEALEKERRKKAEQEIQASLKEKETLLTEIHHRVKNNLAVVSAMMELQAMESDNEELRNKLRDSQSRIRSIALTHELLYQQQNFSNIDFNTNIRKLAESIDETMNSDVVFNFNLDILKLNINQALPCSLIINELFTNALQHAFTGEENPVVHVTLKKEEDTITLSVSDNGVGLPEDFALDEVKTTGFTLIKILAAQLKGQVEISSEGGTQVHLQFTKAEIKGTGSSILDNP